MGKAIGIDLGTTNSVMALRILATEIIPNQENEELTPSVVSYADKEILVGRKAKDLMLQNLETTVRSVKRLIGRSFKDWEVQQLIKYGNLPYTLTSSKSGMDSSLVLQLKNGMELSPIEISAQILKKMKLDAETHLKETVTEAVITVPAYFNEKQKHATYKAAELAGFKVSRLLSEPSAAAIAYGLDQGSQAKTILVYDFGGGTLDISILSFAGGHFMEQGKGGDMWFGGDDIDRRIYDLIAQKLADEFSLPEMSIFLNSLASADRLRLHGEILKVAEIAKIELSHKEEVLVDIDSRVRAPNGQRIQTQMSITKNEFQNLIQSMVARSQDLVKQVLSSVHFSTDMIDSVLMVGGSSSIPAFQESLKSIFGAERIQVHARPMLAIAEGACILAQKLAGQGEIDTGLGNVLYRSAHDYYLKLADGSQMLLVEKQTPLPITVQRLLKYEASTQLLGHFKFSNKIDERFDSIGDLWLSHIHAIVGYDEDRKIPEINFSFTVSENELVHIEASLVDDPNVVISKTLSRSGEDELLFAELEGQIEKFNQQFSLSSNSFGGQSKIFNFIYFSAALAQLISKEISSLLLAPQFEKEELKSRIDKLRKKMKSAVDYSQIEDEDGEKGYFWEKMTYYSNLIQHLGHMFEKSELTHFKILSSQAEEKLRQIEDQKEIERAFSECKKYLQDNRPDIWASTRGSSERILSDLETVKTGLNDRGLSSL